MYVRMCVCNIHVSSPAYVYCIRYVRLVVNQHHVPSSLLFLLTHFFYFKTNWCGDD